MAKHLGQRWLINEELNLRNCFSALRVLIVGFFTAHFLSGSTPHFGELVDYSFTFFKSCTKADVSENAAYAKHLCAWLCSHGVFSCTAPSCFLVLFKNWKHSINNIMEKKFAKKEKNTHSATSLTNIAISTPTILLLILHVHSFLPVYIIIFFLSRSSDILSSSHFPVFFLILAPSFGFWSWVTERAFVAYQHFVIEPWFLFSFSRP